MNTLNVKLILSFAIVALHATAALAQYPTINSERPRIYVDDERLAWCQNNYNIVGEYQDAYNNFVAAYTSGWINDPQTYLLGADPSLWKWVDLLIFVLKQVIRI